MGFPATGNRRRGAAGLIARLSRGGLKIVTAESLTAGLIASAIAEVPGASAVLWGGFVCYDPGAKASVLGVRADTLGTRGVVSPETAREMAEGALAASGADVAVAVTGVAGPGRNAADPPVGTVDIAVSLRGAGGIVKTATKRLRLRGGRRSVRAKTAKAALDFAIDCLDRP